MRSPALAGSTVSSARTTSGLPARALGLALVGLTLASCASQFEIRDRPIPFTDARIAHTESYARARYGLETHRITPRVIVLHWTAIPTLEDSYAAFVPETLPGARGEIASAGAVNVSVQFLVGQDGETFRLMPETWMGRHVIGLNHVAIGVENVGGVDGVDDLTGQQITSNAALVEYLAAKYPTIEYLIGHHEYRRFEQHPLWLESDPDYRTEKSDPGDRFMSAVRHRVRRLGLKGLAEIAAESEQMPD
ncbi:MAG: N-acetyl-anhydromuramyl-L-alanine amidase AmpD [Rhodothermales bacterium]|jgi:N-acetyl-anhydromuramyl-L-alanine amidase AmpD